MKYNAILDTQLSDGSSFVGVTADLKDGEVRATQGQSVFTIPALVGATLFLAFVDGVKYTKAVTASPDKELEFDDTTGTITLFTGQDAGVAVSYLYAEAGASVIAQAEPVTLQEAKDWARIDENYDDALVTDLIVAAREICEVYTNVSFIRRTVTAQILCQLGGQFLPYGPVADILTFKDEDGEDITADDYRIAGLQFKQIKSCFNDPITISYNAGYSVLPAALKNGLLKQIDYMYNNRGSDSTTVPEPVKADLNKYRRVI